MTKKRILIFVGCVGLLWLLTLGIHPSRFVHAYCKGHEQYGQPEVYVFMRPLEYTCGVPFIFAIHNDALPYPLEIAVTVDDRTKGDGVLIESLNVTFPDGDTNQVIRPESPRGGPFGEYTPLSLTRTPEV